ncbi:PilT/PilU family type 4a pilus ATPase [Paludibacterium paludis]|uniref:Twitching motility protein PilT n=1 Tax=Paludibacterium paludis TaxID=1225769 RepID=A0A918P1B9_9NEIS|nr:PilT/PilU family type 4a pilus ATPase [Paludibacterium paludis]GGY12292.1 twitching motility protein PilT [Paludibacterium paludis]
MDQHEARRLIADLLATAVARHASDVFVSADFPPALKIDGRLQPAMEKPLLAQEAKELVQAMMTAHHLGEFTATKEANFAITQEGIGRFRVSAFMQQGHPAMVIRRITTDIPTLDELRLPAVLKDISMIRRGLVIFVGGTGSGKSTSLAALIDWRNTHAEDHIITIEEPVEFIHHHKKSLITQREVGIDTDSWGIALKNTLRQAPDVIMMGEVRDQASMMYALQFAETGHLCLATLHANNANQALERVINFFPEERRQQVLLDLSLNMRAIISQRLVPLKGGKGRCAAVEVLLNSPLVSDLIVSGDVHGIKDIMGRSTDLGMRTFDQSLFELYEEGRVGLEDALRNADSINDLRLRIKLYSERSKSRDPLGGLDHLDLV